MTSNGIPPMAPLAPIVDQMRDLAQDELPEPRTCRIELWDDGTFNVAIWNGSGDERRQIRYERTTGEILWEYRRGHEQQTEDLTGGEAIITSTYEDVSVQVLATVEPPYR